MAIQDDFTIHPYSKTIRHDPTKTTVYTTKAFYSFLMDIFDEPAYLSYETPMKFNTPTSFTMLNGWFLDNGEGSELLKFLYGGGIDTLGYSGDVLMVDCTGGTDFVSGDKDLTVRETTDIGPLLAYENDYGTSGTTRLWIRDTETHGAIAGTTTIEVTTDGGTGTKTTESSPPAGGDEIYLNLFTISSYTGTPNPQLYVYQNHPASDARVRIAEWSHLDNWNRGTTATEGIDILFPIQLGGSLIDSGQFTTFARQTGDTFTFVESTVIAAGRTPIAVETSADEVNITEGEHYIFYDSSGDPSATFTTGAIIQDTSTNATTPPTWYAEIVAHTYWTNSGVLTVRGLRGTLTDTDSIYVGTSIPNSCAINGTDAGDTWVSYDAETTGPVNGDRNYPIQGSLSSAERILVAAQDDGTSGKLLLKVHHSHTTIDTRDYTGTTRNLLYKDFLENDVITGYNSASLSVTLDANNLGNTLISGFSDITVGHINGTAAHGGTTGTFTVGERVVLSGGGDAIVVYDDGSDITLCNVDPTEEPINTETITGDISGAVCTVGAGGFTNTNVEGFNFSLSSTYNYAVFIEGGSIYNTGRSLTDIYAYLQFYLRDGQSVTDREVFYSDGSTTTIMAAEEYIKAEGTSTYAATKPAPFGTLAGGVFFGAQGVWLQGMASNDNNNIKLTEDLGSVQEPLLAITLTVSNTRVDDRVALYLRNTGTNLPEKTQYTLATPSATYNGIGDVEIRRNSGAAPNDTPNSGTVVIIDSVTNEQHRYRFTSRNGTTNPAVFTLPTEVTGTSDGNTSGQTLEDSGSGAFTNVQVGDIIHRTSGTLGYCYVTSKTDNDEVETTLLRETTNSSVATTWTSGDTFAVYSLVIDYTGSDTFFVPYIDAIEDTGTDGSPGSIEVNVTYDTNKDVLLEVRSSSSGATQKMVPFNVTGTISSTGYSQAVIRTDDTQA